MPRKPRAPDGIRPRAVGYVRVSTEEQAREGVSLDAQEEKLRAYCTLQGLELVHLYRDEGVSAGKPLADRPQGKELLDTLERGEAQHVLAIKLDRLFRDAVDCLQRSKEWDATGVAMHLIDMGGQTVNTATAMGRFFLTIIAGAAEMERNLIRERTQAALDHKKAHGERLGSTPFGFTTPEPGADMQLDEVELETVRYIVRRRTARTSYGAIARELEEQGVRTKRGKRWHAATVRLIWKSRHRFADSLAA